MVNFLTFSALGSEQKDPLPALRVERRDTQMITKIITVLRQAANDFEGTGTFADGVFPLTVVEQSAFDKEHSMRSSYQRDYVAVRKLEDAPPAYA
jgi:hypothetical protein